MGWEAMIEPAVALLGPKMGTKNKTKAQKRLGKYKSVHNEFPRLERISQLFLTFLGYSLLTSQSRTQSSRPFAFSNR
jgi:hypothetical protein